MKQTNTRDHQDAIATAFNQLLNQYQQNKSKIATKEEEAEKIKNQELLL